MAVKVALRNKRLKNGKISLYLDFYPPIVSQEKGKPTRREFLDIHCEEKPVKSEDKTHKAELLKIAEGIRRKRELELNRPEIYSEWEREQLKYAEAGEKSSLSILKPSMGKNWGKSRELDICIEISGEVCT